VDPSGTASWVWLVLAAALGAAALSNVQLVTDRASASHSTGAQQGRSRCPGCATALQARDLVPILSFTVLMGRCRSCHAPIPRHHLVGELAGAVAWALTATEVGVNWWLPLLLVAPLILVLPVILVLPAMRRAGPAWLLTAVLPAAGAALLTLGLGGALSGDWAVYATAGLLGTASMLTALTAVRLGVRKQALEQVTT
jgi:leader peptidase (prepilin peptidase)/N-methyltransferase